MLYHTIYSSEKSSQKWITFIHGAGGSSSIWFNQVRFFKKYFNVLLIDLRGHGRSDPSPDGTVYTFDNLVFDIIEVLDYVCLLYTSPSPRDATLSRMPSSA